MHWVLESNITDFGYQWLIKVLERYGIEHTFVKVVPNQNILIEPEFDTFKFEPQLSDNIDIHADKIFAFGSMGLSRVATERGWVPGSFFNEEFTFEKWSSGFGLSNLLNEKSIIQKFSDNLPEELSGQMFIRPCEDNKAFAGQIFNRDKFLNWQQKVISINDRMAKLNADTMIAIAPYQDILSEARMIIIDGQYVTGSYYKIGASIEYHKVESGDPVIEYTQSVVEKYQPAEAFVVDIALTKQGYKIIEINNINSVGLYMVDVEKFVQAMMKKFA